MNVESTDRGPEAAPDDLLIDDPSIERGDTGIRILLSLLMLVIWMVVEPLLGAIVLFSLLWTLVTQQAPPYRLRELTNRLVTYSYRLWRYVTYNEARVPFPFSDFPDALEPPHALGHDDAAEVMELLDPVDGDESIHY